MTLVGRALAEFGDRDRTAAELLVSHAAPTAWGMPPPTMPVQAKLTVVSKGCMWPPLPRPSPVTLPKISAVMRSKIDALRDRKVMRAVRAQTESFASRWIQVPDGGRLLPGGKVHLAGMGPAPRSKASPFWIFGGSLPSK